MPWIGRKSYALIDEKSGSKVNFNNNLNNTKRPKRKVWKFVLLGVFLIIIGIGSWIGFASWRAIKNITSGSKQKSSFFKFLGAAGPTKLNGENRDRINILLMGVGGKNHPGGDLSDTIMLLSIKPKEKTFAFMSIPRDFYVKLPGGGYGKINAVNAYGDMNPKKTGGGPASLSKTVSEITGQPVDYYVRADFDGFKSIVDTLGGVTVNVPKAIYDPYYPDERMKGYAPFRVKAGTQVMNGTTALKYARSRETTSDFDRSKRQQILLLAIKDKATNLGVLANPKKIVDIINAVGDHFYTNFSPEELTRLLQLSKDFNSSNTHQAVLDNSPGGLLVSSSSKSTGYILKPRAGDYSEIKQLAANIFNDTADNTKAKVEAATIEVQNATGQSGNATAVSNTLTNYGYKASPYLQPLTATSETVLYDYTNGTKKTTADFLTSKFNARTIKRNPSASATTDFTLVLGTDYLDLIKKSDQ